MNILRILILVVAAAAAIVAALVVRGAMQTPEPVAAGPAGPSVGTVRVLAARTEMARGERISRDKLRWLDWPETAMSSELVSEGADPEAMERLEGSIVREFIAAGEPIREARLAIAAGSGVMSAVLSEGMRALAVPTSAQAGAGGFILPNDRVDIFVIFNTDEGFRSEVIVENVRVLAIDQKYDDEDRGSVVGSTATLELTPEQAREVTLAVAVGDISLALRSVADSSGGPRFVGARPEADAQPTGLQEQPRRRMVRVVRYGEESTVALGGGQ